MTPDLIAQVLSLPLPVRLALLDADPNAMGWEVHDAGGDHHVTARLRPKSAEWRPVDGDGYRSAWLPCNPLAIVEHAARLFLPGAHWFAYLSTENPEHGPYRARIEDFSRSPQLRTEGQCPHTAAVALLREVVGG